MRLEVRSGPHEVEVITVWVNLHKQTGGSKRSGSAQNKANYLASGLLKKGTKKRAKPSTEVLNFD